jgi:methionyl-tRNA synthetase
MNKELKDFFITSAIFYPNAEPHIGHAYGIIIPDIISRYKKMRGHNVYFQTGIDDHGEKILKAAFSNNLPVEQFVDKNVKSFLELFKFLNIEYNYFFRTKNDYHKSKVQEIFETMFKKGDIYLGEYSGKYCFDCEDYINDKKLINCTCGSNLSLLKEKAYFLKVSKYKETIKDIFDKNFLLPDSLKKEMIKNFLSEKTFDLCVTRKNLE